MRTLCSRLSQALSFGLDTCTNPCSFSLFSPLLTYPVSGDHGCLRELMPRSMWSPGSPLVSSFGRRRPMIQGDFLSWTAPCRKCGKILKNGVGLFCSNFLLSKGSFHPCANAWCGSCYTSFPTDPFPQQDLPEEEDGIVSDPAEVNAFQKGRNGDHLMTVFECDLCHFRNIRKKDPEWGDEQDAFTLMCIRRATLDAFWSRTTGTVTANLRRASRDTLDGATRTSMEGDEMLPMMGWRHLEDRVGMAPAILSLTASLRPGLYAGHLQYSSVRKTRSWYSNAHNAGAGYQRDTIYSHIGYRVTATTGPTDGPWFEKFMKGLKLRQGEIQKQDHPFTSAI